MPVRGKQAVNLKPVKKTPPVQRKEEIMTERSSERSSFRSASSGTKVEMKTGAKTPPAKKKITQAQLDRAKRERERMAQQVSASN